MSNRDKTADAREGALLERTAQLTAHRACCNEEHDPGNGKLAGFCVVCGVPWPCEYAGIPPVRSTPPAETPPRAAAVDALPPLVGPHLSSTDNIPTLFNRGREWERIAREERRERERERAVANQALADAHDANKRTEAAERERDDLRARLVSIGRMASE